MSNLLKPDEHKDRRVSPRVTPDPLLIIRLPSGNEGIVLDVSHEGVGFLASAPVGEAQTIRFEISRRSTPGFEATGQLMWRDRTGTRGGLRFTQLPEGLRAIIPNSIPHEQSRLEFEPKLPGSELSELQEVEGTVPLASRINSGIWTFAANSFTAALACLVVLAIWYSTDRRDALNSFSHLKSHMSASLPLDIERVRRLWTHPPRSTPTPLARPAVAKDLIPRSTASDVGLKSPDDGKAVTTEIVDAPKTEVVTATAPPGITDEAAQGVSEDDVTVFPAVNDHGQRQFALARRLLQQDGDPAKQAEAAQLLWQATGRGSVAAEVELAGLYLEGRAVPKSCSQALILLTAARNRESALAERKLNGLPQYGCE